MSHFIETRHKEMSHTAQNTSGEPFNRQEFEPLPINKPNSDDLQCNICNARFTAPTKKRIIEAFDNHKKFHSNLFPYECPFCYRGFNKPQDLKYHKKEHISSGRKFSCTICDFFSENF